LWDGAIKSGAMMSIAEDDVVFHSRFESHGAEVIERLPPDSDVMVWGFNFDLFICFEMLPGISMSLS
jgi:hypothetical protein